MSTSPDPRAIVYDGRTHMYHLTYDGVYVGDPLGYPTISAAEAAARAAYADYRVLLAELGYEPAALLDVAEVAS